MKLSSAHEGQVVRNLNNKSHYRYERPEKGRIRIYPLEHFPNGLLIAKPTPTIVDPDLDVVLVGDWHDSLVVEGRPSHSRAKYEAELLARREELVLLEEVYEQLPVNGTGKQSRGSHQNKIKNCRARIGVLEQGLAEIDVQAVIVQAEATLARYAEGQLVQVPSGLPARIEVLTDGMASIVTSYNGRALSSTVPTEVLRPWALARCATI